MKHKLLALLLVSTISAHCSDKDKAVAKVGTAVVADAKGLGEKMETAVERATLLERLKAKLPTLPSKDGFVNSVKAHPYITATLVVLVAYAAYCKKTKSCPIATWLHKLCNGRCGRPANPAPVSGGTGAPMSGGTTPPVSGGAKDDK